MREGRSSSNIRTPKRRRRSDGLSRTSGPVSKKRNRGPRDLSRSRTDRSSDTLVRHAPCLRPSSPKSPGSKSKTIAQELEGHVSLGCQGRRLDGPRGNVRRSEEHTSELQSQSNLVCRLL